MKIISCIGQKGGGSKSTTARTLAAGFTKGGWSTHLADLDGKQQTCFKWCDRREKAGLQRIECVLYKRIEQALKVKDLYDLIIIDGKPAAEATTLDVAMESALVIVSTGPTLDDLEPSLELGRELVQKGIDREKIIFLIAKSPSKSEATKARATIESWKFKAFDSVIRFQTAYGQALDVGKSLCETTSKSLNEEAEAFVDEVYNIIDN
ncbi:ParA family protein [Acerihabitans sp. TG2]|uniref:ParA family protein n=1 Tax=Acerihabitans sp. TG2 TaxID=3096008 RepID=UPI002B221CEF|nr:ParA family protein [Acerihabitans sp. TG2]MEA9392231.1 ParA family protein [Acerihabitans sp. TG2]